MKIRLLPMSKSQFSKIEDVIQYLTEVLPRNGGKYYYRRKSISYKENVIVAFQYGGKIVGSAIMVDQLSETLLQNGIEYSGCFVFDTSSFVICKKPVTSVEIRSVMPEFKGFNQTTQNLSDMCIKLIR